MSKMKRWLVNALVTLLVIAAVVYLADYGVLRYRVAANRNPFDTVTVQTLYALHKRRGMADYVPGDAIPETCVNSLFPHLGDRPCWWVRRHAEKQVDIS